MRGRGGVAVGVWLIGLVLCIAILPRIEIRTDMTAFLPRSASLAQKVLTEQVRNGAASRLILLGIEGAPPAALARLSRSLARDLRQDAAFAEVSNGDAESLAAAREFFWRNRYLLSRNVAPERFTAEALHAALSDDLGLLASSDLGMLLKTSLRSDPTRELLTLLDAFAGMEGPHSRDGAWLSADERRALLLVHTRAPGSDIDAQQRAMTLIEAAFARNRQAASDTVRAQLLESGPGVFAVRTRATIKRDATRLSLLATAAAAGLLLFAYRSVRVLFLGLLPVATGALAGIAAVALGFGFVHGITLGFGVTLIGESVDYAIYLFTQTEPGGSAGDTLGRIWPTLRLGAMASVVGFSAMLFSDFVGFAQLGLFSICGLVAAAGVTRFVLPEFVPHRFFAAGAARLGRPLLLILRHHAKLRPVVLLLAASGAIALACHPGGFWDRDVSSLSPIPAADQRLDRALRQQLGVPDLRYVVVFRTGGEQRALEESEAVADTLRTLVARRALAGFVAPSQFLPSDRAQRQRQAALPEPDILRARFDQALVGLPFRPNSFDAFFDDVAAAKKTPLLTRADLPESVALQLDTMLLQRGGEWTGVIPLRDVSDPGEVAAAVAASGQPGVEFVDFNREADQLLATYQREAVLLAAIGSAAIVAVLLVGLRSLARVAVVVVPLAASVIVTAALLTIDGGKLSIFMIVGFLLIVAVGSNYCLFFERQYRDPEQQGRSVASIVLANLCTVSAYGLMSFSGIPVLHDIGATVAIGTLLTLFFAAALGTRSRTGAGERLPDQPPRAIAGRAA